MLKSLKQLHWSIYSLALASGVVMTGFMMLLPLLPRYSAQLGFNEYDIGLLVAAFFVGRVLFQFPLGVLSDRIGRRGIMSASLFLFTVATATYALSTDAGLMMALRLLQGMAASGFAVGSQAYINDRTPAEFRGLANGITSSAINIGVIVGPILGGTLSQTFSMQAPFWAGGALGALCFVISLFIPRVDIRKPAAVKGRSAPQTGRLRGILSSVFCLPSISLSLVQFLLMMAIAIFLTSAPILTAEILGWSAGEIALAFALGGAAAVISSPFLGQLSDRIGRIWVIAVGLVALTLEGLIVYLHPGTPLTMAAFAIGGAGTPAYFNAFYSLIGDVTVPQERGAVTGFVGSFGEWGSIIGSSLLVPVTWRYISVAAPMAVDVLVSLLTLMLVIVMKTPLQRQIRN
jgi:DHA1 family multidrug resistance protein-like MFS transporter